MSALQYVGKVVGANSDLVYKDYIGLVKNADLTVAEIDNVINTGLAGYATVGYTDSRDALNATKAYVDAGDAQRLHLSQKTIANGVVPLDATGRVPPVRINAPLTQKWVRGPWTPAAYPAAAVSITTEATLFTCPVTDPGYPYKLVVFGMLDGRPDRETEYPIVNVRVGATNGEIVAQGLGHLDVPDASEPVNGEKFSVPNTDGLEVETWNQTSYEGTGSSFYKAEGGEAVWNEVSNTDQEWHYRRLGVDALTLSNYQKIRLTIGTTEGESPIFGDPHRVRLCARMNTAETDWVGFEITHNTFTMQYAVDDTIHVMPAGGGGWTVSPGPSFGTDPASGTTYDVLAGTVNSLRQFLYFRNNVLLGGAVDGGNVTKVGPTYRGWGWHARATALNFFQNNPPDIAELLITDAPPSFSSMSIIPFNPHTHITRTGSTVLYIQGVRSGGASTCVFSSYKPRLNVFCVPA